MQNSSKKTPPVSRYNRLKKKASSAIKGGNGNTPITAAYGNGSYTYILDKIDLSSLTRGNGGSIGGGLEHSDFLLTYNGEPTSSCGTPKSSESESSDGPFQMTNAIISTSKRPIEDVPHGDNDDNNDAEKSKKGKSIKRSSKKSQQKQQKQQQFRSSPLTRVPISGDKNSKKRQSQPSYSTYKTRPVNRNILPNGVTRNNPAFAKFTSTTATTAPKSKVMKCPLINTADSNSSLNMTNHTTWIRIACIGDTGVGKSSLCTRFTWDRFFDAKYSANSMFRTNDFTTHNNMVTYECDPVRVMYYDLEGGIDSATRQMNVIGNADAIIMVYDVTGREYKTTLDEEESPRDDHQNNNVTGGGENKSLNSLLDYYRLLHGDIDDDHLSSIPIFYAGSKIDDSPHFTKRKEEKKLNTLFQETSQLKIAKPTAENTFFTSSKRNINVDELFYKAIEAAVGYNKSLDSMDDFVIHIDTKCPNTTTTRDASAHHHHHHSESFKDGTHDRTNLHSKTYNYHSSSSSSNSGCDFCTLC